MAPDSRPLAGVRYVYSCLTVITDQFVESACFHDGGIRLATFISLDHSLMRMHWVSYLFQLRRHRYMEGLTTPDYS